MDTDVLLLSAGLGTRLRPLTNDRPKALVEVAGKPLIAHTLEMVARSGIRRAFINLHYRGEMIEQYVGDGSRWGIEVEYSREPVLLDSGGAVREVEPRMRSTHLVVINADSIFDPAFDFSGLVNSHLQNPARPRITVLLRKDQDAASYNSFEIDEADRIVSFKGERFATTAQGALTEVMYGGIHIFGRDLISTMPPRGTPFNIVYTTWLELLRRGEYLAAYRYAGRWSDIGTVERLAEANRLFAAE